MDNSSTSEDFLRRIGQVIATLRRRHKWSQEALAQQLGVSQRRVAKLESGAFDLRLSTIVRLAAVFGIRPAELLDTTPDPATTSIRHRGPLQGLARTGWTRAKPDTPGAIPVLDLRPRAGPTRAAPTPLAIAWASPPADHPSAPTPDHFLAQIRGNSMQPTLLDGQWCLFAKGFSADTSLGKLCLVRELDPAGLTAWTVKKLTGIQLGGDERLTLQLDSLNPAHAPRQVVIDTSSDAAIAAVLLEPLPTAATTRGRARA